MICLTAALLLLLMLSACTAVALPHASGDYSREQLLSGELLGVSQQQPMASVDLLKVNDDMRKFLAQHVSDEAPPERKAEQILRAILQDGLKLEFQNFKTYTADQAYYQNTANCLSFTSLFIALAREAGVDASFQQVEVPPNWVQQDGVYAFNLHINALVKARPVNKVVDFNLQGFDADYPRHLISDAQATAQYHNNMAVDALGKNDLTGALAHLRQAVLLDDSSSYYWNNLGALYRRAGRSDAALASYLIALSIDAEPIAMINLARHFRTQGNLAAAEYYENKTRHFREKNPFYHYQLAQKSYAEGDYFVAERRIKKALTIDKHQHRFYRLLALVQLKNGLYKRARRSLESAAKLARKPQDRALYSRKLALLAGASS